jgi:hypothetical protein
LQPALSSTLSSPSTEEYSLVEQLKQFAVEIVTDLYNFAEGYSFVQLSQDPDLLRDAFDYLRHLYKLSKGSTL